jgi:hypothetical protein
MLANRKLAVVLGLLLVLGCGQVPTSNPNTPSVKPSEEQSFGQRQLEQLLADRPDMRDLIPDSHPVYQWVAESFDGDHFGQRVYWNDTYPRSGRPAEHASPYYGYPPYISIAGSRDVSPVDKWTMVVYELHNLLSHEEFQQLQTKAIAGDLDADGYANGCVKLEFDALEQTRDFLLKNPLPSSSHGRDEYYNWITGDLGTFEEYQKAYEGPAASNNFSYFREYYNSTIEPYRNSQGVKSGSWLNLLW